jgi:predicted Zn-dependent peptidase
MRAFLLTGLAALTLAPLALSAQPRSQQFTLPNGLRVVHLEDHERPLVRARLHLLIAATDTPPGRQGLVALALRMVDQADAAGLKADVFDRFVEDAGIQLTASLEPSGVEWRLLTRSRDQDRAFGLLADRLLRTVFDPAALVMQRLATWRETEGQETSPDTRLRRALVQTPGSRPTQASLGAITLEDLLVFHARVFRPDRAVLVLHGDLGLEQAKRLVLLSLGSWTAKEPMPSYRSLPVATPVQRAVPEALLRIPAPGAALRLQAMADRPDEVTPEAAALLGLLVPEGAILSRVQVTVEAERLVATLDTGAGGWSQLQEQLGALRQRSFSQADLDRARAAFEAKRALESLDPGQGMDAAFAEAEGRRVQTTRLKALTPADLNAALRRWLDPARFRIGAVGDPEALKALPADSDLHLKP